MSGNPVGRSMLVRSFYRVTHMRFTKRYFDTLFPIRYLQRYDMFCILGIDFRASWRAILVTHHIFLASVSPCKVFRSSIMPLLIDLIGILCPCASIREGLLLSNRNRRANVSPPWLDFETIICFTCLSRPKRTVGFYSMRAVVGFGLFTSHSCR